MGRRQSLILTALLALAAGLGAASPAEGLSPTAETLVFLDPGHGGPDAGVQVGSVRESERALALALALKSKLDALNLPCALSRDSDVEPGSLTRVARANASGAQLYIGLHLNYAFSPVQRGPRIFAPRPVASASAPFAWENAAGIHATEARSLAEGLAKALGKGEPYKVSVQSLNLAAFKGLALPAVFLEMGFLNGAEGPMVTGQAGWAESSAERLLPPIVEWLKARLGEAMPLPPQQTPTPGKP